MFVYLSWWASHSLYDCQNSESQSKRRPVTKMLLPGDKTNQQTKDQKEVGPVAQWVDCLPSYQALGLIPTTA